MRKWLCCSICAIMVGCGSNEVDFPTSYTITAPTDAAIETIGADAHNTLDVLLPETTTEAVPDASDAAISLDSDAAEAATDAAPETTVEAAPDAPELDASNEPETVIPCAQYSARCNNACTELCVNDSWVTIWDHQNHSCLKCGECKTSYIQVCLGGQTLAAMGCGFCSFGQCPSNWLANDCASGYHCINSGNCEGCCSPN